MRKIAAFKSLTYRTVSLAILSTGRYIFKGNSSTELNLSSSCEVRNKKDCLNSVRNSSFAEAHGSCYYFNFSKKDITTSRASLVTGLKATHPSLHATSSSANSAFKHDITIGSGSSSATLKDSKENPNSCKPINGIFKTFYLDTSLPPLSEEELINWRVDRFLHLMDINMNVLHPEQPIFLLPRDALVTSLGPKMDQIDSLYRRAGWYTPSEVAEVLIALTPTFFVEVRHIFSLIPPNVLLRLESNHDRRSWINVLFANYPMLFILHKPNFNRSVVKLNTEMWFVRAHPDFKKGNRLHYKHNAEYRADVGGVISRNAPTGHSPFSQCDATGVPAARKNDSVGLPEPLISGKESSSAPTKTESLDSQIFRILISHLPRVAGMKAASAVDNLSSESRHLVNRDAVAKMRYRAMPLVKWVNGFPQEELDILNTVSQEHVLTILQEYPLIFQLLHPKRESPFLYTDREALSRFFEQKVATMNGIGSFLEGKGKVIPSTTLTDSEKGGEDYLDSQMDDQKTDNHASLPSRCVEMKKSCASKDVHVKGQQLVETLDDDGIGLEDVVQELDQNYEEMGARKDLATHLSGQSDDQLSSDQVLDYASEGDTIIRTEKYDSDSKNDEPGRCEDSTGADHTTGNHYAAALSQNLDELYLRRLPPEVAPRSLSNFNHLVTPTPELVEFVASFLAPPPSLSNVSNNFFLKCQKKFSQKFQCSRVGEQVSVPLPVESPRRLWRWVRVQTIYTALSPKMRQEVRQIYKGLVNLLRLHGELFEVSEDLMHVIAHDPRGVLAPIVPTQKTFRFQQRVVLPENFDEDMNSTAFLIGEEVRQKYKSILGDSQIPTTRSQLALLDPHNPLLFREVLYDEISQLLPHDRAISKFSLMNKIPPIMKAAMGKTKLAHAVTSKYLTVFYNDGVAMVQRKNLKTPVAPPLSQLSLEESVEELRAAVPVCGATILALKRLHLSKAAVEGLNRHFGSIYTAVKAYPQYFNLTESPNTKTLDALVTIVQ